MGQLIVTGKFNEDGDEERTRDKEASPDTENTLLSHALNLGLTGKFCRRNVCGNCMFRVREGISNVLTTEQGNANARTIVQQHQSSGQILPEGHYVMGCQSRIDPGVEVVDDDDIVIEHMPNEKRGKLPTTTSKAVVD